LTLPIIINFILYIGIEPGEDEDGEDAVHDKINQDRGNHKLFMTLNILSRQNLLRSEFAIMAQRFVFMISNDDGSQIIQFFYYQCHSLGCVVYPYRSSEDEALFMVLDGHGEQGDRISEFVMRQVF
jgi:hypothetical protein